MCRANGHNILTTSVYGYQWGLGTNNMQDYAVFNFYLLPFMGYARLIRVKVIPHSVPHNRSLLHYFTLT